MSKSENIKAVLDYLDTVKSTDNYKRNPPSLNDWLELEIKRLHKEYDTLSIVDAEDRDIISHALIELSFKYNTNNQFTASNKIDEVRKRFLDNTIDKYVKTNLNSHIKVKLNERGKKIYHDYWKDVCGEANISYKLDVDEEGYSSFQIHEFMNIFGEYAHLGAEPFLKTMDVIIERSK